jgi:hypothetical protein
MFASGGVVPFDRASIVFRLRKETHEVCPLYIICGEPSDLRLKMECPGS